MDKVRILHCADIHFDSPFGNLKREVTKIRQQDIKNTFIKIIKLCEAEDVNILLMCGDVFDNYSVSRDTLNLIRECFERIKDTYIFITPGNHDPINKDSFYNMIEWPSNVHIYGEEIESIYINELNTVVIGAGFSDKYMRESVLKEYFPGNDEECIRIMALHGEVAKGGEKNEYNPITENEILKSKVQYLALGHRHTFSGFLKAGMTTYAYSGCPEGRGFDETGEKGIIIGDVYADGVNLEFKNICERQYFYEDIDVTGANSNEEIKQIILSKYKNDIKNNLYKINLIGEISNEVSINTKLLEDMMSDDFFYIKINDETKITIDFKELSKEYSVKGIFVESMMKKIEEARDEEELDIYKEALKLGLMSLSGRRLS